VKQGATVLAQGERRGNFFPPAVLADVTPDMDAYREEFFGPVAMLFRAQDEDEAIRIANDTPFGLGSYLYTTDPEQADRLVGRIDAGMVWVNLVLGDAAELPFGGTKRSGFGRELGRYALDEFVNRKLVRKAGRTHARAPHPPAGGCGARPCQGVRGGLVRRVPVASKAVARRSSAVSS
jgi:succinate-semialdehyde dehydrogenase / glutarate-semialdehyde dehydrogenase